MVNLLIAMISRRYEQVARNSDVVWKFSRARLIREFALYPGEPLAHGRRARPLLVVDVTLTDFRSPSRRCALASCARAAQHCH